MAEKCKRCGIGPEDVARPVNFKLNQQGICFTCWMEEEQVILDGRSDLQRHLDDLAV